MFRLCVWLCFLLSSSLALAQESSLGGKDFTFSLQHQKMDAPYSLPDIEIEEQVGGINIPLIVGDDSSFSFITRGRRTALNVPLEFTDRGVITPQEFGTIEGGFAWNMKTYGDDKYSLSATYGYAGTNLLGNGYTPIVTALASWESMNADENSWIFMLSYSNNRIFLNNIPLPGIAYSINGDNYKVLLGLPFIFINWRPNPFSISLSLSPFSAGFDLALRIWGPIQIFGNAAWTPKAYQNLVNDGTSDRLIFDEKNISTGIRMFLGRQTSFSAGYVYGFGRRFFLGESILSSNSNPIAIGDGNGVMAKLQVAF